MLPVWCGVAWYGESPECVAVAAAAAAIMSRPSHFRETLHSPPLTVLLILVTCQTLLSLASCARTERPWTSSTQNASNFPLVGLLQTCSVPLTFP